MEDTVRIVNATRNGKGTKDRNGETKAKKDRKRNGKTKGQGNGTGIGIVKHTPGGDDISRPVALQLQKEMSQAEMDTEG
jgi:hypothetical protein